VGHLHVETCNFQNQRERGAKREFQRAETRHISSLLMGPSIVVKSEKGLCEGDTEETATQKEEENNRARAQVEGLAGGSLIFSSVERLVDRRGRIESKGGKKERHSVLLSR